MSRPATYAPRAAQDLRDAIAWITQEHPAAAERLRQAALVAARRIGANPAIGAPRPRLADPRFRFLRLPGFPYLMIYTAGPDLPRILRVLHMARDLPLLLA